MPTITVPVRAVVAATPRTRILTLDLRGVPFEFGAGQAVMVGLHGSPLRKPYSIASAPSEVRRRSVLELLLLVDESGGPDPHLERATAGTPLDMEGPFGSFGLDDTVPDAALLVAGGTGIAPLRSMIVEWLSRDAERPGQAPLASRAARAPQLSLVYSARLPEELAYREELEALQARGRLRLFLTVTRGAPAPRPASGHHGRALAVDPNRGDAAHVAGRTGGDGGGKPWAGRRGRIDEAMLARALPSPRAHVVACGPPRLVDDVRRVLARLGVAEERFHTQRI